MRALTKTKKKRYIFNSVFFPLVLGALSYGVYFSLSTITNSQNAENKAYVTKTCNVVSWDAQITSINGRNLFLKTSDCGDIILTDPIIFDTSEYTSITDKFSKAPVKITVKIDKFNDKHFVQEWSFVTP